MSDAPPLPYDADDLRGLRIQPPGTESVLRRRGLAVQPPPDLGPAEAPPAAAPAPPAGLGAAEPYVPGPVRVPGAGRVLRQRERAGLNQVEQEQEPPRAPLPGAIPTQPAVVGRFPTPPANPNSPLVPQEQLRLNAGRGPQTFNDRYYLRDINPQVAGRDVGNGVRLPPPAPEQIGLDTQRQPPMEGVLGRPVTPPLEPRQMGLARAQVLSGVETLRQIPTAFRLSDAARELDIFGKIDAGEWRPNPNVPGGSPTRDTFAYWRAGPEERARLRAAANQRIAEALEESFKSQDYLQGLPQAPAAKAFREAMEAGDWLQALAVAGDNPVALLQHYTLTNLATMVPIMVTGVVGGVGGAALSSAMSGAAGYLTEFGTRISERLRTELERAGVDPNDRDAVSQALRGRPELVVEASRKAGLEAIGPALADAIAGRFARSIVPGRLGWREVRRAAGNAAYDVALGTISGAAGEALSKPLVGERPSALDVTEEALGGLGSGAAFAVPASVRHIAQSSVERLSPEAQNALGSLREAVTAAQTPHPEAEAPQRRAAVEAAMNAVAKVFGLRGVEMQAERTLNNGRTEAEWDRHAEADKEIIRLALDTSAGLAPSRVWHEVLHALEGRMQERDVRVLHNAATRWLDSPIENAPLRPDAAPLPGERTVRDYLARLNGLDPNDRSPEATNRLRSEAVAHLGEVYLENNAAPTMAWHYAVLRGMGFLRTLGDGLMQQFAGAKANGRDLRTADDIYHAIIGGKPNLRRQDGAREATAAASRRETGKLDMSPQAREQRAREQGFTIPAYHGTDAKVNFRQFRPGDGELGPGVYVAEKPQTAASWARGSRGRILPLRVKDGDYFDLSRLRDPAHGDAAAEEVARRFIERNRHLGFRLSRAHINGVKDRVLRSGSLFGLDARNDFLRRAGYLGAIDPRSQIGGQRVVFDPKNIRSAFAAFDPARQGERDILASRRENPQVDTPAFKRWFGDSKVVDANGRPLVVYHGTTHDFSRFDPRRSHIENFLGQGLYFSSKPADVSVNYAGLGPDLQNRIDYRADEIENGPAGISRDEAKRLAHEELVGPHDGALMPVYLAIKRPLVLGGPNETVLTYDTPYNSRTDRYGKPRGTLARLANAIIKSGDGFYQRGLDVVADDLHDLGIHHGDIPASQVLERVGYMLYLSDIQDADGKNADREVLRRAFQAAGFDGVIDHAAASRFSNMAGIQGATHYIAFSPQQVKSAIGNSGAFNPRSRDILRSEREYPPTPQGEISRASDVARAAFMEPRGAEQYRSELSAFQRGEAASLGFVTVGPMPVALRRVGMPGADLIFHRAKIGKVMHDHPVVAQEMLAKLPELLADPAAILHDPARNNFVVLVAPTLGQGAQRVPVVAAVGRDRLTGENFITTFYDRTHIPRDFLGAMQPLYVNERSGNPFIPRAGRGAAVRGSSRQTAGGPTAEPSPGARSGPDVVTKGLLVKELTLEVLRGRQRRLATLTQRAQGPSKAALDEAAARVNEAVRLAEERHAARRPLESQRELRAADAAGFTTPAYHFSKNDFSQFDPDQGEGFAVHVGTPEAANDRGRFDILRQKGEEFPHAGRVMPLRVKLGRSIDLPDPGDWSDPYRVRSHWFENTGSRRNHLTWKPLPGVRMPQGLAHELSGLINDYERGVAAERRGDPAPWKADKLAILPDRKWFAREMRKLFLKHGIDSISYQNIVEDSGATSYAILRPENIRSVHAAFNPWRQHEADLLASERERVPGFFSALTRAVDGMTQNRAPAKEWIGQLRNLTQRGVRQEELDWSGVIPWLEEQKGAVTRDQLREFLAANEPQISEVQHVDEPLRIQKARQDYNLARDNRMEAARYIANIVWDESHRDPAAPLVAHVRQLGVDPLHGSVADNIEALKRAGRSAARMPEPPVGPEFDAVSRYNSWLDTLLRQDEKLEEVEQTLRNFNQSAPQHKPTKYSSWKLAGGGNYRELLFTMPPSEPARTYHVERREGFVVWGLPLYYSQPSSQHFGATPEAAISAARAAIRTGGNLSQPEPATRWFVVDEDGRQGDRGEPTEAEAQAKADRFNANEVGRASFTHSHWEPPNVIAHARITNRVAPDGAKVLLAEEFQSDLHAHAAQNKARYRQDRRLRALRQEDRAATAEFKAMTPEEQASERGVALKARIEHLDRQIAGINGEVPEAPFAKSWPMFVAKRLLREAVEGGYDRFGWTTGETQADRYDLRRHVAALRYDPDENTLTITDHNGEEHEEAVREDDLEDWIGADLAQRMRRAIERYNNNGGRFDEEDARDRIAGNLTIRHDDPWERYRIEEVDPLDEWTIEQDGEEWVLRDHNKKVVGRFDSEEEAEEERAGADTVYQVVSGSHRHPEVEEEFDSERSAERYIDESADEEPWILENEDGDELGRYVTERGAERAREDMIDDEVQREREEYPAELPSIEGLDLHVGGETKGNLYDKLLVNEMNKYLKKWGAKVSKGEVVTDGYWEGEDAGGEKFVPEEDMFRAPRNVLRDLVDSAQPSTTTIWQVDITPQMRTSIEQGQPLFSRRENPQVDTPAFKRWFGNSKVVDANGRPLVVYHGTGRPDRVGARFRKTRATSGPMSYFTDDPLIASSYAVDKPDTSLDADVDYHNWFKAKLPGQRWPVTIDRAWWHLTEAQQKRIAELAPQVTQNDQGDIVVEPGNTRGLGAYDMHVGEARGNHMKALVEEWLNSAALFNNEGEFLNVLKAAGFPLPVTMRDPAANEPAVYPVYLRISRPLETNNIPDSVVDALDRASRRTRARPNRAHGDMWGKKRWEPGQWMALLREDLASGKNSHAWTSIPDWVSKELGRLGYDGIKDTGGKNGGQSHTVWIPFDDHQVKSATGNRGTFDPSDPNILRSERETRPALARPETIGQGENRILLNPSGPALLRLLRGTRFGLLRFIALGDDIAVSDATHRIHREIGLALRDAAHPSWENRHPKWDDGEGTGFIAEMQTRSGKLLEVSDINGDLLPRDRWPEALRRARLPSAMASQRERNPGHYSALTRAIDEEKLKQAPLQTWVGTFARLQAEGKIKQEELDWSGVIPWLEETQRERKAPIPKAEVLDYLRANELEIEQVRYGNRLRPHEAQHASQRVNDAFDALAKVFDATPTEQMGASAPHSVYTLLAYLDDANARENMLADIAHLPELRAAVDAHEEAARALKAAEERNAEDREPRWRQYTVASARGPANANYREYVFRMPPPGTPRFTVEYSADRKGWVVLRDGKPMPGLLFSNRLVATQDADNRNVQTQEVGGRQQYHHGVHWPGIGNPVAHVRVEDRATQDGELALHVEEAQSDAHGGDPNEGYGPRPKPWRRKERERLLAETKEADDAWTKAGKELRDYFERAGLSEPVGRAAFWSFPDTPDGSFPPIPDSMEGEERALVEALRDARQRALEMHAAQEAFQHQWLEPPEQVKEEQGAAYIRRMNMGDGINALLGQQEHMPAAAREVIAAANKKRVQAAKLSREERDANPMLLTKEEQIAALEAERDRLADSVIPALDARVAAYGSEAGGKPNLPFKTSWPLFVMRRLLKEAAEEGYDAVTWTVGADQARRYNLSRAVDRLAYHPTNRELLAFKDGALQKRINVEPEGLDEYLGRETAQRMREEIAKAEPGDLPQLTGLDLELGGEKKKNLYDRLLVNELGKFVKRFGAKVRQDRLMLPANNEQARNMVDPTLTPADRQAVGAQSADPKYQLVWRVDITPQMREALRRDQPLFSRREAMRAKFARFGNVRHTKPARLAPSRGATGDDRLRRRAPMTGPVDLRHGGVVPGYAQGGAVDDYDYAAARAAGEGPDGDGHWTDRFKRPNHPTYSEESALPAPQRGGRWMADGRGNDLFMPGPQNLQHRSLPELRQHFRDRERPGARVLTPRGVTPIPDFRAGGLVPGYEDGGAVMPALPVATQPPQPTPQQPAQAPAVPFGGLGSAQPQQPPQQPAQAFSGAPPFAPQRHPAPAGLGAAQAPRSPASVLAERHGYTAGLGAADPAARGAVQAIEMWHAAQQMVGGRA